MQLQQAGVGNPTTRLPVRVMSHSVFEKFAKMNTGLSCSSAILLINKNVGASDYQGVLSYFFK